MKNIGIFPSIIDLGSAFIKNWAERKAIVFADASAFSYFRVCISSLAIGFSYENIANTGMPSLWQIVWTFSVFEEDILFPHEEQTNSFRACRNEIHESHKRGKFFESISSLYLSYSHVVLSLEPSISSEYLVV